MDFGKIADIFAREGYVWSFSDGRRIPSAVDIQKTVFRLIDGLKDDPTADLMEVGRLVVKRDRSHGTEWFDVYVHVMELE